MNDPLGDRMKGHEAATRQTLGSDQLLVVRVDGRAFHTFTRGLDRPFDASLMEAMRVTAEALVAEISGALCAYVQSDEISVLAGASASEASQHFFGGVVQKVASVSASVATAAFAGAFTHPSRRAPATFDARAFALPSLVEAHNYLVWRQRDAQRNAVSMLCHAHLPSSAVHSRSTGERRDLLADAGVDLAAQDPAAMHGQLLERVTVVEPVTYRHSRTGEEITTEPVARHRWQTRPAPDFHASGWLQAAADGWEQAAGLREVADAGYGSR